MYYHNVPVYRAYKNHKGVTAAEGRVAINEWLAENADKVEQLREEYAAHYVKKVCFAFSKVQSPPLLPNTYEIFL